MTTLKDGEGEVLQSEKYFLINDALGEEEVEVTEDNNSNNEDASRITNQPK